MRGRSHVISSFRHCLKGARRVSVMCLTSATICPLLLGAAAIGPVGTAPSVGGVFSNELQQTPWANGVDHKLPRHLVQAGDDPGDGYGSYPPNCRNKYSFDQCAIYQKGCSLQNRNACAPICAGLCDDP